MTNRVSTRSTPIRVALRILDRPSPAYLEAAREAVARVAGAEVVLVLVAQPTAEPPPARRLLRWLDEAYDWLERHTLPGGPRALATRHAGPLPDGIPVVRDTAATAVVAALRRAQAEVVIDLTAEDRPDRLPVPLGGWWRLRYANAVGGTRRSHLTRPDTSPALAVSLLSIERLSGERLETGNGVSALHRIGFGRDRDAVYWRSSLLPARRLAQLVVGEDTSPDAAEGHAGSLAPPPAQADRPWTLPPFGGLGGLIVRKVMERTLYKSGWSVFIRHREPGQGPPRDLSGFRAIGAPKGRFYADPFVTTTPRGPRLYVEDCPDGAHKGRISTLRMDESGNWIPDRVMLDDLAHRAYPHVLRTESGLLMTPDGGRSGGVDLFLDRGGGAGLESIGHRLEDIPASDPTVLWHDGRYWLFVTVTGFGMSPWDELHLYSAASITGLWHPHPRNPVVADVRRARPAGRIFRQGADLIRPGQDCSVEYGRRIVLSAITTLTQDKYEENPIGSIEPTGMAGIQRTHTYSFDDSIEALDGYGRVPRWPRRGRASR